SPEPAAALVHFVGRLAEDEHAEHVVGGVRPVRLGHLAAVGPEPGEVLRASGDARLVPEIVAPAEHRVRGPDGEHRAGEPEELALVAQEVVQGEPIVAGHDVDAGRRAPLARLEEIAAARETRGELAHLAGVAAPELPGAVAVLPVPLAPADGEPSHLVAARPE